MKPYALFTTEERRKEYAELREKYQKFQALKLNLNMARGKPGMEQLDLVSDMLAILIDYGNYVIDGIDVRNYGELSGLPAAKRLFAEILGTQPEEIFVAGNASLQLMYDLISKAHTHGLLHSERPWCKEEKIKFLCPSPGYDRHFKICETFGMEMITIAMTPDGPDMDTVEEAIKDPTVKGMWCVPKYSNPDGIIYSDGVIDRIAAMKPAAPDFALMWDNAYCVHEFEGEFVPFRDMLSLCRAQGNADMVYEFASTSKITYPGAGVGVMAASVANQKYIASLVTYQTIGFDKINHLRHVCFLKNKAHTLELMQRHAEILKPKFHAVLDSLKNEIEPLKIAQWTQPKGGYFVSVNSMPGTAKRIVALMKDAGVILTGAGATFPYGIDPNDSNIRIAPTLPPVEELKQAMEVFCICMRMAALEQLGIE
ncbi:MAG: aminotransferase class I/II-fold pyridoxal phosphate-dependent enzyme [Ruminococcaceae bacterium]|nr:aminotransferase class I/II-fold pyridoxal phosphate-dependent enzyme [Oscillospiraceae bacterium]